MPREGVGRGVQERRSGVPADRAARAGHSARVPRQGVGQGDPARHLRRLGQHRLGHRRRDHDTSAFAVATLRRWWDTVGRPRYTGADRLLICADGGGSNGSRVRAWKIELGAFAADTGLQVTVCHLPPGTSKWNKIEHRLFSQITMNWRGRPLKIHQIIVDLIASTTTATGLTVHCTLDTGQYPTGISYTTAEVEALPLQRHDFHGDWNYTLLPDDTP